MSKHVILNADEGMILTDGVNYGRTIYLAEGADPAAYFQITEAEYNIIMEREPDLAGVEDYEAALARLGVE